MKNYKKNLIVTSLLLIASPSNARNIVDRASGFTDIGNGGDAILCRPSLENPFSGYYSLDYIATYNSDFEDSVPVAYHTWQESIASIEEILKPASAGLAQKLKEFRTNAFNISDRNPPYLWQKTDLNLVDVTDEDLLQVDLPENCKVNGNAQKYQAVIRQSPKTSGLPVWKTLYNYNENIVQELETQDPVQLSYLILHEFLWNYSSSVVSNRILNRFLHSKEARQISAEDIKQRLINLGIILPDFKEDFLAGCGKFNAGNSEINDLSLNIQRGFHTDIRMEVSSQKCDEEKGCLKSYRNITRQVANSPIGKLNFLHRISSDNSLYIHMGWGQGMAEDTGLECIQTNDDFNLKNCTVLHRGFEWWNSKDHYLGEVNFNGRITSDKKVCLFGETYSNDNENSEWFHYLIKIQSKL